MGHSKKACGQQSHEVNNLVTHADGVFFPKRMLVCLVDSFESFPDKTDWSRQIINI